jgi:hypothetical protein
MSSPSDNQVIVLPDPIEVVVTTGSSFRSLAITADGTDVTAQVPLQSSSRAAGRLPLQPGSHTVTARAVVECSSCSGGTSALSTSRSFVVRPAGSGGCVVTNNTVPIIALDANVQTVGSTPGRRVIGYRLRNGKSIRIIVDDAPGLVPTQMRIEADLDPVLGATTPKRVEGLRACAIGAPVATASALLPPGTNVGTACTLTDAANNHRSGCTATTAPVVIDQSTTTWLSMNGEEYIDASFWLAFGGRSVRFLWLTN